MASVVWKIIFISKYNIVDKLQIFNDLQTWKETFISCVTWLVHNSADHLLQWSPIKLFTPKLKSGQQPRSMGV
jgi:hypothetical protein